MHLWDLLALIEWSVIFGFAVWVEVVLKKLGG
jgi:hypothetical protein